MRSCTRDGGHSHLPTSFRSFFLLSLPHLEACHDEGHELTHHAHFALGPGLGIKLRQVGHLLNVHGAAARLAGLIVLQQTLRPRLEGLAVPANETGKR